MLLTYIRESLSAGRGPLRRLATLPLVVNSRPAAASMIGDASQWNLLREKVNVSFSRVRWLAIRRGLVRAHSCYWPLRRIPVTQENPQVCVAWRAITAAMLQGESFRGQVSRGGKRLPLRTPFICIITSINTSSRSSRDLPRATRGG